jgi:hypothetical protein
MSEYVSPFAEDPDRQRALEGLASALDFPDLEHSELDRRLQKLAWPKAPEGVKERLLESLLEHTPNGSPARGVSERRVKETEDLTGERVQWHELSRRRLDILSERGLRSPRRERRYAAVL